MILTCDVPLTLTAPFASKLAFGEAFIGSYFPSATDNAKVPVDEPSTNSTSGGSKLLNASMFFAGRIDVGSCAEDENNGAGGFPCSCFPCPLSEKVGEVGECELLLNRRDGDGGAVMRVVMLADACRLPRPFEFDTVNGIRTSQNVPTRRMKLRRP